MKEAGRALADAARKLHGTSAYRMVVPVPCGHSMRNDCLFYRLAVAVAEEFDAAISAALQSPLQKGSSHPQQAAKWRKPTVLCPLKGKTLLVDDVCTTGRHMSLSLVALREAGADALGLAWIGSR